MAKIVRYGYKIGSETIIEAIAAHTQVGFNGLFYTKKQVEKQIKEDRKQQLLKPKQKVKIFKLTVTY